MIRRPSSELPTLHLALLIADHAAPPPATASGALRVVRAALADALAMTVPELIVASRDYGTPTESQLRIVFTANRGSSALPPTAQETTEYPRARVTQRAAKTAKA